jgi:hypothetical protein
MEANRTLVHGQLLEIALIQQFSRAFFCWRGRRVGRLWGFRHASDNEEANWRAEFEKLGRETVRIAIYRRQGFSPDRKRELALLWLREKEAATEDRERAADWYLKWTFDAALAAAVLAFISMLVLLGIVRL